MLTIKNLIKNYGNRQVIKNLNFTLNKGESLGILGPNGAGKTTLLKIICGLNKPSDGGIILNDMRPDQIATIFEDQRFLSHLSGFKNIKLFLESFPDTKKPDWNEFFFKYDLYDNKHIKYKFYSSGMKRRMDLMSIFINGNKALYILDEPTNGLDIDSIILFNQIVINIIKEKRGTFIISSHHADELVKICDRFLIINKGSLLAEIKKEELLQKYGSLENAYLSLVSSINIKR